MEVGYVGLGNMGAPMAGWILDAGHALVVHDLRREAARGLEARGARWAASPRAVAERSELVCTCLPGPEEMRAVYLGPDGILAGVRRGGLCADHTTNDPETVREVGRALGEHGSALLDAPLDGGREGALAGALNVFVGGDAEDVARARPVLEAGARHVVHVGDLGAGSVTKIVHNALAMSIDLLLTECLTLGVKAGVALPRLVEAFRKGCIVGQNMTFTERMPATLFRGDFTARFALELADKDFRLAQALAGQHRVPTALLDGAAAELAEAMRRGWAGDDRTRASCLQEHRAGVALRLED